MPPTNAKPKAPSESAADERPVLYPEVTCLICDGDVEKPGHAPSLDAERMKSLLGWEEIAEGKEEPLLVDEYGKKIVCRNNQSNRPFDEGRMDQYAQDVLCRKWAGPHGNGKTVNGEAMVVGRYGQTLSMQHRGIALIIATQRWEKDDHWRTNWPTPPVMDSVMTFGVDESGDTTITIDNVKPRSGADVFFSDPSIFRNVTNRGDRTKMCKMLDYAVKFCWYRTGMKDDAYAPRRTHSEAKEFIATHRKIELCVKHVHEQDSEGSIAKLVPLGTAAGMLYLMGSAGTSDEGVAAYREDHDERHLDWSLWVKACDFWVHLSEQDEEGFKRLRRAIKYLAGQDGNGGGPTEEKVALVAKAWLLYSAGTPMTDKNLGYEFDAEKRMVENGLAHEPDEDDDGVPLPLGSRKLTEFPSVGGIDLGDPDEARKERQDKEREEKKAEKERLKAAEKALKDKSLTPPPAESKADILTRVRKQAPGELLCWPRHLVDVNDGAYDFAGNDALIAAKHLGLDTELRDALQFLRIPKEKVEASMKILKAKGCVIGVCGPARNAEGKIFADYLGTYDTPGGYINKPEPASPEPAAPVPSTRKAASKAPPAVKEPSPPTAKPKAKPKGATKPVLRGGK